jgi:hypothetical protein
MRCAKLLVLALTIATVALPKPARAAHYDLGLGANYWFDAQSGLFDLTLRVSTRLARRLSVGGRFGAALVTSPSTAAIPLDITLRGNLSRAYVEALAGPWIFFEGDAVRGHVAGGFGLQTRDVSAGIEVGYLSPHAILGFKLAFPL